MGSRGRKGAMQRGRAEVCHGESSAAWELGAPALAAIATVSREEERGRLEKREGEWRLKQLEGWE
jgi:hypothetical protein